jgi:hypothetical protein
MATTTPWGPSQHSEKLAHGIVRYSTAGHGGIHLSPTRNVQVHPAWRIEGGWYEEDLDWNIVAYHFPEAFPDTVVDGKSFRERVDQTLRSWKPHQYMAVTGLTVTPEESFKLREDAYREAHQDDLVTVAAETSSSWHPAIPDGMVGVTACKGGRSPNGHYADPTMRYFLVPAAEYREHRQTHDSGMGFVIDPARHQEVPNFKEQSHA